MPRIALDACPSRSKHSLKSRAVFHIYGLERACFWSIGPPQVPLRTMAIGNASFPYHEPSIETILIWTTFLLLLNSINFALDGLVYCGLLGQILVGVWFGTPGAQWLSQDLELAVQQLGYLGLIMLVYEGMMLDLVFQVCSP